MQNQVQLPSSTLVYLYADLFAPPPKGITKSSMTAPQSGEKRAIREFVIAAYQAALMDLVDQGVIVLKPMEVRKMLVMKETTIGVELSHLPVEELPPLAKGITASFQNGLRTGPIQLREVVFDSIGGQNAYPWRKALQRIREEAFETGLVVNEEKAGKLNGLKKMLDPRKEPPVQVVTEDVAPLADEARVLQERLAAFEQNLGELASKLSREIAVGLDNCKTEHSGLYD